MISLHFDNSLAKVVKFLVKNKKLAAFIATSS